MQPSEIELFNKTHFCQTKKQIYFRSCQTEETNVPLESGLMVISPSVTIKKKL